MTRMFCCLPRQQPMLKVDSMINVCRLRPTGVRVCVSSYELEDHISCYSYKRFCSACVTWGSVSVCADFKYLVQYQRDNREERSARVEAYVLIKVIDVRMLLTVTTPCGCCSSALVHTRRLCLWRDLSDSSLLILRHHRLPLRLNWSFVFCVIMRCEVV
jgi:hypothetical protein